MFPYLVSYISAEQENNGYSQSKGISSYEADIIKIHLGTKFTTVPGDIFYDYNLTNNHKLDLYFDIKLEQVYLTVEYPPIFHKVRKRSPSVASIFSVIHKFDNYIQLEHADVLKKQNSSDKMLLAALDCYDVADGDTYVLSPKLENPEEQARLERDRLTSFKHFVSATVAQLYYPAKNVEEPKNVNSITEE